MIKNEFSQFCRLLDSADVLEIMDYCYNYNGDNVFLLNGLVPNFKVLNQVFASLNHGNYFELKDMSDQFGVFQIKIFDQENFRKYCNFGSGIPIIDFTAL